MHRALSLIMLLSCEEALVLYTSPTGGLRRALVAFDTHHGDVGVAQSLTCLCVSLCMMRRCRCAVLASGAVSAALSPVTWVGRGAWGGGGHFTK